MSHTLPALALMLMCLPAGANDLDARAVEETARRTFSTTDEVRSAADANRGCESGVGSLMALCGMYHFVVIDLRMADLYRELESILNDAEALELLSKAQEAWVAYRDAECDFSARGMFGYGRGVNSLTCAQVLTKERIRLLQDTLTEIRDAS